MKTAALIGLGSAARRIHLPAYAKLASRVRVIAGCDPATEAREEARQKWGIAVYDSPAAMLEAVHPDIAVICTPPAFHRDHALLALAQGIPVFCEKPAAEDLAQMDEMIHAAEAAGRIVAVNNQFPAMKIHAAAKKMIGARSFGRLLYLHVWHTMRTDDHTEAGWRGQLQRRLCFEFGIHVFELVRFFFGMEPTRLLAHMPGSGGAARDAVNVIALEFADGRGASIVLDRLSRGPDHYLDLRLDGEFAAIHTSIGGQLRFEAGMHTRERRPYLDFTLVKGGMAVLQNGTRSTVLAKDDLNPFCDATAAHFSAFLDALEKGTVPPGEIHDNRRTLALVTAAYDSAAAGRWVEMREYEPRGAA